MDWYLLEVTWESGKWETDRMLYTLDDIARVDEIIDEVLSSKDDKVLYHSWTEAERYDGIWERAKRA